ncbi:MAG: hypothetical protein ACE5I7_03190 [Candidatus Binatia bacterium]
MSEKQGRRLDAVEHVGCRTDLDRLASFHYEAMVLNDNTVWLGGMGIDMARRPPQRSSGRACLAACQLPVASWRVSPGRL